MKQVLLLLSLFPLFAQSQQAVADNIQLGYQEFPTVIKGHTADTKGNQYYSGNFRGQLKINNQVLAGGRGLDDLFWAKTDSDGHITGHKTFGTAFNEYALTDGLVMGSRSMIFSMVFFEPANIEGFAVQPYTTGAGNKWAAAIACADTNGMVQWVRRTNLTDFRVYYAHNIFHIVGMIAPGSPAIKFEDSTVIDSIGGMGVAHLMLDEGGQLLGAKVIKARKSSQFVVPLRLHAFSDQNLLIGLRIFGDSSFDVSGKPMTIPNALGTYDLLLKTDTAYVKTKLKVLNPRREGLVGGGNLPVCIGGNDSVYIILSTPANFSFDGLTQLQARNTLYALDTSLTARRMASLNNIAVSSISTGGIRRKLYFRNIAHHNQRLYVTGVYSGANESAAAAIPARDTLVQVLPGVQVTIDQNGTSRSFIASCNGSGLDGQFAWYGRHEEYETSSVSPMFLHSAGNNRLAFAQNNDNVWNPWLFDNALNRRSGSMQRNADLPEVPLFVRYLEDGSRLLAGYARGKTAFDTSTLVRSNSVRRDVFIARFNRFNQLTWAKRLHSTLLSAEIRGLEWNNDKAWLHVNYSNSYNESNFIRVDSVNYPVGENASLIASLDTTGAIRVFGVSDSVLKKAVVRSVSFFSNGDLLLGTDFRHVPFQNFPTSAGASFFRIHATSGAILGARKLYGSFFPNVSSLKINGQDEVYVSGKPSLVNSNTTMYMHDGLRIVDSIKTLVNSNGQALLKLNWGALLWYKGFAAVGASTDHPMQGDLLLRSNKPVLTVLGSTVPTTWNGQPLHNGTSQPGYYLMQLDGNGVLQQHRFISGIVLQNLRSANGKFYLSGRLPAAISIDTISLGHEGYGDAIGLVLDSNFIAKQSFRLATPYTETLTDMDLYKDSIAALAYTAQIVPQLFLNRNSVAATDYGEDAYIATMLVKSSIVTGINNPASSFQQILIAPNPVEQKKLQLFIGTTEPLRSLCQIASASGQLVQTAVLNLLPGTQRYVIDLPQSLAKGVYHIAISNKKWTTIKTFIVH